MAEDNRIFDIHQRIFLWVIAVLKFLDKVPRTIKTTPIISQLASSITSVGANDREANSAESSRDFCHKYGIAKKEADESVYWLLVIGELYGYLKPQTVQLSEEGKEIISILATIIRKSKITSNERENNSKAREK
ncbi:MAG: four helix bundle protein [Patescibacteria group bacterium]